MKIKKYIENNFEALSSQDDEANLISQLTPSLRDEVLSIIYGETIEQVRFFKQITEADFLWKILPLLKQIKIDKNDTLYWPGDNADDCK